MKIALASDHAGYKLKKAIKKHINENYPNIEIKDYGTNSEEPADYPIYVSKAAKSLRDKKVDRAIVMCGSGIGASMSASKVKGVIAPLIHTQDQSILIRENQDAKAMALSETALPFEETLKLVDNFIKTQYKNK